MRNLLHNANCENTKTLNEIADLNEQQIRLTSSLNKTSINVDDRCEVEALKSVENEEHISMRILFVEQLKEIDKLKREINRLKRKEGQL